MAQDLLLRLGREDAVTVRSHDGMLQVDYALLDVDEAVNVWMSA